MKPSTPMIERAFIACIIMLVLLAMLTLLTGCAKDSPQPTPALRNVGEGIAAAEAQRQIAVRHADQPAVVADVLGEEGQKKTLGQAAKSLDDLGGEVATLRGQRNDAIDDFNDLNDWWVVQTALWISAAWFWFKVTVGLLVAIRIAALFFPAGSAIGYWMSLVSGTLLPVVNMVFELIWKRIAAKQGANP